MLKVLVADDGLSTHDEVTLIRDGRQDSANSLGQMGDIRARVAVAACHHLCQTTTIVGHDQRQSVEFP